MILFSVMFSMFLFSASSLFSLLCFLCSCSVRPLSLSTPYYICISFSVSLFLLPSAVSSSTREADKSSFIYLF